MEIQIADTHPEAWICTLTGELDMYNAPQLKERLETLYKGKCNHFIFDLGKLEYLDSSGIGVLVTLFAQLKKANKHLVLVRAVGSVLKVLKYTSLTGLFPIEDSIEEALALLKE